MNPATIIEHLQKKFFSLSKHCLPPYKVNLLLYQNSNNHHVRRSNVNVIEKVLLLTKAVETMYRNKFLLEMKKGKINLEKIRK